MFKACLRAHCRTKGCLQKMSKGAGFQSLTLVIPNEPCQDSLQCDFVWQELEELGISLCSLMLRPRAMEMQQQQHWQLSHSVSCAETAVLANQLNSEGFTLISLHPGWVATGTSSLLFNEFFLTIRPGLLSKLSCLKLLSYKHWHSMRHTTVDSVETMFEMLPACPLARKTSTDPATFSGWCHLTILNCHVLKNFVEKLASCVSLRPEASMT